MKRFRVKTSEIKGFVIGVIVTSTVASSMTVFGDVTKRQLDAVFSGIKIVVDGYQITPKDSAGNVVEPFIVGGSTYLPVRAVAEALGQNVSWEPDTQTVYIGELKSGVIGFDTLRPYKTNTSPSGTASSVFHGLTSTGFKVRGVSFASNPNAFGARFVGSYTSFARWTESEFNLNGDYTKLETGFAVSDSTPSNTSVTVTIYGDGTKLHSATARAGDDPASIAVNLIGVNTLRIAFSTGLGNSYDSNTTANGFLFDAKFTPIS